MNTKKNLEIITISFRSTIIGGVCIAIIGGMQAFTEHSYSYWIIFFSILFIVNYPIGWLLFHYLIEPVIQGNKQK